MTSIDFLPGATVRLYAGGPAQPRPGDPSLAETVVVAFPSGTTIWPLAVQLAVFPVAKAGVGYHVAGDDGRGWRVVEAASKFHSAGDLGDP